MLPMHLKIEAYDAAEQAAIDSTGYAQLVAFRTKTYHDSGFPTRATQEQQLIRYVDNIPTFDLPERLIPNQFFRATPIQTDFTFEEVGLLSRITNGIGKLTESQMGQKVRPRFNILGAAGHFRIVNALSQLIKGEPLSVFEIGPGCGYLGIMLGLNGYKYMSYDVTQGTYLWQNRMYQYFFADEFCEIAANKEADLANLPRISHLPWWEFMELYRDCSPSADLIVSNTNLGEMDYLCLRYSLRLARQMFEKSDLGLIICGNYGSQSASSAETIEQEFATAGYRKVFSNLFHGFILEDRSIDDNIIQALENDIPLYGNTSEGARLYGPMDFVDFNGDDFQEDFDFFAYLADWPNFHGQ
jgi:hypothetical protein